MTRLAEVVEAMAGYDVDAMLLGRESNARAVASTTRLWLAGTRAFAPGCVVVREPPAVHVLANSDDAIPPEVPHEHLYGITWNPEKLLAALTAIPGLTAARRIAVDGMTPAMHALLSGALGHAQFVGAAAVLAAVRASQGEERRAGVAAAGEVAAAGLAAMVAAMHPGVRPRTLRGACAAAFATPFGVTTPAFEAVVAPLAAGGSTWFTPDRALAAGDVVVLRAGALRNGWEASLARTYRVGHHGPEAQPPPAEWPGVVALCRTGTRVSELRARGALVHGVGYGVEPLGDDEALPAGATLALEVTSTTAVHQDVIVVPA